MKNIPYLTAQIISDIYHEYYKWESINFKKTRRINKWFKLIGYDSSGVHTYLKRQNPQQLKYCYEQLKLIFNEK